VTAGPPGAPADPDPDTCAAANTATNTAANTLGAAVSLPRLVFIGLLPPPIDGQRLATRRMRTLLARHFRLAVEDLSPRWRPVVADRLWRTARAVARLVRARRHGCRRVYLAPYTGHGAWLAVVIVLAARLLGYRSTLHLHSALLYAPRRPALAALSLAAGDRGRYLCLGARLAVALARGYPAVRETLVVGNAIVVGPPPQASPMPPTPRPSGAGVMRLGHMGNLTLAKGLATVLALAPALTEAGIPFVIDIAGPADAEARPLLRAAQAAEPAAIRYRGPLAEADKDAWFRGVDVFVLPTRHRHEASPLVLLEAMRAGVVPIATDVGVIADELGDAGVVVAEADPAAFVAAVVAVAGEMSRSPQRQAEMSRRAAARYAVLHAEAEAAFATLARRLAGDPGESPPGGGGATRLTPPAVPSGTAGGAARA
jgi:glycosyltransferase involved in cell wall biosynthesis